MRFIEAIKEGISNAENYHLNKDEIFSVFKEANQAIFDKTNSKEMFIGISDNSIICKGVVMRCIFSKKHAYPVQLDTTIGVFVSNDKDELIKNVSAILSSAAFGFYIKKYIK